MSGAGRRLRFDGEIWGAGTTSGVRMVIGRWPVSPYGSFADAMVERADGTRILIAPTHELAGFIGRVYAFDDVIVGDVAAVRDGRELRFTGGPLQVTLTSGRRHPLGWLLRAVPRRVATSPRWCRIVDPIARVTIRGVRTFGRTAGGTEFYGATDRHDVVGATDTWGGEDLGTIAPIAPPVRFGFSSTPARPSVVSVVTTVDEH